jgi:hypothetical protein
MAPNAWRGSVRTPTEASRGKRSVASAVIEATLRRALAGGRAGIPHFDGKRRIEEAVSDLRFPSHATLRPAWPTQSAAIIER